MAEYPAPRGVSAPGISTPGVHGAVFVAMFLISFSYPVGEAIANEFDTGVLLFIRFGLATAIFAPLVAWRHGLAWPGWRALAGYAAISASLVVFFWCMFFALRTTSALNTGAISTLIPGLTAIAGAILVGERLGWHRLAALGIGLIGALWVVFRGDWDRFVALDLNQGDLIYFAGCVAMGFYSPLVKLFHRGEPVMVMTLWIAALNAVGFLLIANDALWTMAWSDVPLLRLWRGRLRRDLLDGDLLLPDAVGHHQDRPDPRPGLQLPSAGPRDRHRLGARQGTAERSHRPRRPDRARRKPGDPARRDLRGPLRRHRTLLTATISGARLRTGGRR